MASLRKIPEETKSLNLKRIIYYLSDSSGCGYLRCALPASWMEERGYFNTKISSITLNAAVPFSDVFVFQRQYAQEVINHMRAIKKAGKKVVFELDDDIWSVSKHSPAYYTYHEKGVQQRLETFVSESDAVSTTTPELAEILSKFNKNISVVPNFLDFRLWQTVDLEEQKEVRIIWQGGPTHYDDLIILKDVFARLLAEVPEVKLVFLGYLPEEMKNSLPPDRIELHKGVDVEAFPKKMASLSPTIGIAPVANMKFNHSKSDIKYREYAAMGIPTVAFNYLPYSVSIKNEKTGFLVESENEFLERLIDLARNRDLRKAMGAEARTWAAKNVNIAENIHLWVNYFSTVLST